MQKFLSSLLQSTSKSSDSNAESLTDKLESIESHADAIPDRSENEERLGQLEERLEWLLEDVGQQNQLRTELSDYVKSLKDEASLIFWARIIFGIVAIIAVLFCLVAPITICVYNYPWFAGLPEYPRAALIIGMFAAGVIILQNLVKAVYRSAAERQADEFLPPQLKLIHELTSGFKGG